MTAPFQGLRTTIYRVPELQKAKKWYSAVLGITPYFDEPYYVGYEVGGYELGLHPEDSDVKAGGGGVETYWGVEDVKATYEHFLSHGATSQEAPHNVGGPIEVATVKDPWGNTIGLIYNPDFKAK